MEEVTLKEISLKSIKRETLSQQVIDQIIELLLQGKLKPGDKLPTEAELTEWFSVSRPVLREALSSLETMGIIHRKTREGTFFSSKVGSEPFSIMLAISTSDIQSVMEARMALELGLVTMAALKITDDQVIVLEDYLQRMSERAGDYHLLDREFHKTIAYSANNPALDGLIEPLLQSFDRILMQIPSFQRNHELTIQQHREILEALKKRDPITAYRSMYDHLNFVRVKVLHKLLEQQAN